MGDLGLNEHHQTIICDYIRFARHQRAEKVRTIDKSFDDLKLSRLSMEDTFTSDEVSDMIEGLDAVVKGDVEDELINAAHTNVLLLRQVFSQAEKWHLKLQADISELENQKMLDVIKSFEESEKSGQLTGRLSLPSHKLEPVTDTEATGLLKQEIERLQNENEKLKGRAKALETQAVDILSQKSQISECLEKTSGELQALQNKKPEVTSHEMLQLQQQLSEAKVEMSKNLKESHKGQANLEEDLVITKHKLLEVQEHLEMAEKELDKKFQQTSAYKNMKQMLTKKNDQIKELRNTLARYETSDGGDFVD